MLDLIVVLVAAAAAATTTSAVGGGGGGGIDLEGMFNLDYKLLNVLNEEAPRRVAGPHPTGRHVLVVLLHTI